MIDSGTPQVQTRPEPSPWTVAFVVLGVIVLSFGLVAQLIGFVLAWLVYGGGFMDFLTEMSDPIGNESMKGPLLIAQACTTLLGLAVFPYLFWKNMRRTGKFKAFFTETPPVHFLYVIGIVVFSMGIMSVLIEWNSSIEIPGAFGRFAREIEDKAAEFTKFMTSFSSFGEYLIGVLVIAVFAGFAEELAFRGLLQTELQKSFKNYHAAIWVSAIFFSALHLQFYGFVPRVFLGALFGYMYYWSGNLLIPMFAHFVNNFIGVSAIYFGVPIMDPENTSAMPWYGVLITTVICALLLYRYRAIQPKPAAAE